ncbi:MAG TPA: hypothetical protein VJ761_07900 [Ktedonobacteraceae bacterium]|nr:hypothetical protein [Ktedonobacteraceae bacterium]
MKHIRYIKIAWILLLAVLVLGVSIITPAAASNKTVHHTTQTAHQAAATSINLNFYIATAHLKTMVQSNINSQVPTSVNSAITSMINTLPKQDQGWAYLMATTLIQPSATLVSLAPQKNGFAMTLRLSLYPGDPKPTTASMLISFSVLNSTTAQVSASPLNGPALVSGPVGTFKIPLGTLNKVTGTPNCGGAALDLNLQYPVVLGQAQSSSQVQQVTANTSNSRNFLTSHVATKTLDAGNVNSFVEITAATLSTLGNTISTMPLGNGLTAENFRISVQKPDIAITSDIYWNGLNIGNAVTTMALSASGGKMVVHVVSTTLNIFGFISFPMNSYNAQTEQTLNAKLGNAFTGVFDVAAAGIGPNSQLTCAAQNSLVLSGASVLG